MKYGGFRFPNPFRLPIDQDFERFLAADPSNVHNPWPQIVDLSLADVGWAQPIVHAFYSPATRPVDLGGGLSELDRSLPYVVGRVHEQIHLALNVTPAKDLARLHLASAYDAMEGLLSGSTVTDEELPHPAFAHLVSLDILASGQELSEISVQLRLVEELIATSFSLLPIYWMPDSSEYNNDIIRLEQDYVDSQIDVLADQPESAKNFEILYDTFRKVARISQMAGQRHRAIVKLGTFLESVEFSDENIPQVMNPLERCILLSQAMRSINNFEELDRWISKELMRYQSLPGSATLLYIVRQVLHESKNARYLYGLTLSENGLISLEKLLASESVSISEIVCNFYADRLSQEYKSRPKIFMRPEERGGRWYILQEALGTSSLFGKPFREGVRASGHVELLALDSFRQQLEIKAGFVCPLRQDERCLCAEFNPDIRSALIWMTRQAENGQFGPGEWRALPSPCGDACL